jgi:hypothetical protein
MDYIINEVKKMLYGACERFSKQLEVPINQVQFSFFMKYNEVEETVELGYLLRKNKKAIAELKFRELLGVRVVINPKYLMAPPFILKTLSRFCDELEADPREITVVFWADEKNKNNDVRLYLFNGSDPVKEVTLTDIWSEESMTGLATDVE